LIDIDWHKKLYGGFMIIHGEIGSKNIKSMVKKDKKVDS
jgi:hypothetical protein